jgi:hypothetical protein
MQEEHLGREAQRPVGRRSGGHWLALAVAALGLAALVVLRFGVAPDARGHGTHEQLGLPACASMELFGLPCPGCGVTTATAWAVRGELARAFLVQPFGLVVLLAIPLFALYALQGLVRGRDLGRDLSALPKKPWLVLGSALLLAAWLYKLVATLA